MKEKHIGIMLVHSATATVCSLRTRGMLAGTKLHAGSEPIWGVSADKERAEMTARMDTLYARLKGSHRS